MGIPATAEYRRTSVTQRLEQLRGVVASRERPPSRRIGVPERKPLGEWIAEHQNATASTGDAVHDLLAGGVLAASAVNDLEDCQTWCAEHMRAPVPSTVAARGQSMWEWARFQQDPGTTAAIAETRARCRVSIPGAHQREKPAHGGPGGRVAPAAQSRPGDRVKALPPPGRPGAQSDHPRTS